MVLHKTPIVVVCGPTASGKTGLAIKLAKAKNGEIVSADSMQIYRGMDIGTAKPTPEERAAAVHHMIDLIEPDERFSTADYVERAGRCISDIAARGKLPILTGGTGLYINSLMDGVRFAEMENDFAYREQLQKLALREGNEALLERLRLVDPQSAEKLHSNDLKRIIRALEVYKQTGVPLSEHNRYSKEEESLYRPVLIGLTCRSRERLYERINRRVDQMVEEGLLDEVKRLRERGVPPGATSMQAIGYKEFNAYFDGRGTLDEAVEELKRATRRYAKRQLSWFRRDTRIHWIEIDEEADPLAAALRIVDEELQE